MSTTHATQCANCGAPIATPTQKFCPECGQPTPAHRIDWQFLWHELQHGVFHVDRGILFTVRHLITRPGHMIREYLEGRRGGHFKPLMMIMILGAVVVFLGKTLLGTPLLASPEMDASIATLKAKGGVQATMLDTYAAIGAWMESHFAISTILLIPLMTLGFKLAFRRYRQLSYPEWLVIITYISAMNFLLYIVAIALSMQWPAAKEHSIYVMIIATAVALVQFFKDESAWKITLRTMLGYVYYFVLIAVLMFIAAFGYGVAAGVASH